MLAVDRLEDRQYLAAFEKTIYPLEAEDRSQILAHATLLLEEFYVHLHHKRAYYGVEPVTQLHRLADYQKELPDRAFHRELTAIFSSLRDLHTQYLLPKPYRGAVAFLPFVVERCVDEKEIRYVVTRTFGTMPNPGFDKDVEVLHWNGVPIDRAVERAAGRFAAATPAARTERAVDRLTFRSLEHGEWPDEAWVDVHFSGNGNDVARFEWCVGRLSGADGAPRGCSGASGFRSGLDAPSDRANRLRVQQSDEHGDPEPRWSRCFRAKPSKTRSGRKLGHLRIHSFNVADPDAFVVEIASKLAGVPQEGLVIDIRGNPGGNITAAERLLPLFAKKRPVKAQPFQLRATPRIQALAELSGEFRQWRPSLAAAMRCDELYAFPVALDGDAPPPPVDAPYPGPTVLLVDARTYSAADMFAAAYVDHRLGKVVGTCDNTGAGGANAWSYECLLELLGEDADLKPLKCGASFTIALRRCFRVGFPHGGVPLEDFGVAVDADRIEQLTRKDVLGSDYELLNAAAEHLDEP